MFQGTLKNQVHYPLVALFAKVMGWRRFEFFQIKPGNKILIAVVSEKIGEYHDPTEHPLYKGVNIVARLWLRGWLLCRPRSLRGLGFFPAVFFVFLFAHS